MPEPFELWTRISPDPPTSVAFATLRGDVLLADARRRVWSLDGTSGRERWFLETDRLPRAVAVDPEGSRNFVLLDDGRLLLIDAHGRIVSDRLIDPHLRFLDLDPAGQILLMVNRAGSALILDLRTQNLVRYPFKETLDRLRLLPDASGMVGLVPAGSAAFIRFDEPNVRRLRSSTGFADLALSGDGRTLAFAAGSEGVLLTDTEGNELARIDAGDAPVTRVDVNADASLLAFAAPRGRVRLVRRQGTIIAEIPSQATDPLLALGLTRSGHRMLMVEADGRCRLFALDETPSSPRSSARSSGRAEPLWERVAIEGERSSWLGAAALAPDGRCSATLDRERKEIRIFDAGGGVQASTRAGGAGLNIAFQDAETLVAFGADGVLAMKPGQHDLPLHRRGNRSYSGISHFPGLPFALAWFDTGTIFAQEWSGEVRWELTAKTRILRCVLGVDRIWAMNLLGQVAELDFDGKPVTLGSEALGISVATAPWNRLLALASGSEVCVLAPGVRVLWKWTAAAPVAVLLPVGDHLVVRDAEDRATLLDAIGKPVARGGPWPGRWAVAESADLGGVVVLQGTENSLACHRLQQGGMAWKCPLTEPVIDLETSPDGRFALLLAGPKLSLWPLGSASAPTRSADYLEF